MADDPTQPAIRRLKRSQLPLNALRAFEAAARHLSFKKAADELSVTPAAVSQQIRTLEDYLGIQLFRRTSRALILTERAQESLEALRQGFDLIEDACSVLQSPADDNVLSLSVSPSFAAKWLIPRLQRYYEDNANVVVKIAATNELTDFSREDTDLAIRYGAGHYPGLFVEELMREEVFPVCSPALLEGDTPVRTPCDMGHVTLIHDDSSLDDESNPTWPMWLKAAGVKVGEGQRALHFNQTALAIEAAIAGRGVALAKRTLAESDLKQGRLVRPFRQSHPVDFAYYMVCPEQKKNLAKVSSFMAWLREEAGQSWAWEI
ncbi:LysR family transcriptional regulator [Iodidimonas gelatinilytica]|uniref:LysR family transcriptional regulator n=1 Tax=Iodidimonas gelatinilytica TaxID=1236966 RepID=A0A5A7N1E6_9PROT|nr:transcriptional regulator GcvA [Iodidimonas gelatinilytica]GEQ97561.1 LysR family transcriptional regulator [Iodidimonas gelatinilytica]GER01535.1 LysR family transcriptional regulator [Iodidimonas gelatinilytica]